MKIKLYGIAGIGLLLSSGFAASLAPAAERPPNIVFILADDQRHDELGCAGEPILQTPHIDRLATQGVRFSNMFVVTPICMASRATIFSGLVQRTHQWAPANPDCLKFSDEMVHNGFPFRLREAGYRTGFYGKNHVQFECGTKSAFDTMFDDWKIIHRDPYFKKMPDGSLRHSAELIGDRSADFLKAQTADRPFFLYMSFNIAHAEDNDHRPGIGQYPWPREVDGLYENIQIPRPHLDDPAIFDALPEFLKDPKISLNRARWFWRWDTPEKYQINMRARYRMITGMDRIIGRVLGVLKEQGLAGNTVIIYTADNGLYRGNRGFAGKWSHFEESLRVPLIIDDPRLPEKNRGAVADSMALNLDLPSTMLRLAGVPVPETYQGESLLPIVRGTTPANWRNDFFCEHHQLSTVIPAWSGVRSNRYVYACYDHLNPPYEFLHDLKNDPDELENLAGNPEYSKILDALRARRAEYIRKYTAARPKRDAPSAALPQPSKKYAGGTVEFSGTEYRLLGNTPKLEPEDSYVWKFQVRIAPSNPPGAILLGNRTTPGLPNLNFMKITADRGVQIFGGPGKTRKLKATLPRGRWIDVRLSKRGRIATLFVDGKEVASGAVDFSLPPMPCYLGGDPKVQKEFAHCSIRKASAGAE